MAGRPATFRGCLDLPAAADLPSATELGYRRRLAGLHCAAGIEPG